MKKDILKDAEWQRGGRQDVLRTYLLLHQKKLGAHWMWIAIERIAAGEPEEKVFAEYGYKWHGHIAPNVKWVS